MKRLALASLLLVLTGCPKAPSANGGGPLPPELVERDVDASDLELPPMRELTLENGLTLLVLEDHELPVASIALFWPAGDTSDPGELAGVTSFASSLLRQGTTTRDAQAIAGAIEAAGGELSSSSELEWTSLQARVLSRDLPLALELIADIAQNASFPEDELEDARRAFIGDAKQGLDDPERLASRFAGARLYGASNPYAVDLTEASLRRIRREDVVAHAKKIYGPSGAILAVAGDVDGAKLLRELQVKFGAWKRIVAPSPVVFPAMPAPKRRVILVDKPGLSQTFIRVGLPALKRADPDYVAALLANNVLGGSYSSRLTRVVRAEGGKTYGVSSWFTARREQGAFWVETSTRTPETVATLDLVLREVAKMRDGGVSANELANAKSNRAGSYVRNFESGGDVLGALVTARLLGLPRSSVTGWRRTIVETPIERVNATAKRLLDVDDALIVVVGDAGDVRPMLEEAYGTVEVVDFRADPREVRTP